MEEQTTPTDVPKKMKTRVIAYLAFTIAIAAITMGAYGTYQTYELRAEVHQISNDTANVISIFDEYAADRKAEMLTLRYTIADVWLKDLTPDAEQKIRAYEAENKDYYSCIYNQKQIDAIGLVRNLWPGEDNPQPAKYLVLQYSDHFLAYKDDGTINCYANPIPENQQPSACSSFCASTADGGTAQ